jgi:hypothetical protein
MAHFTSELLPIPNRASPVSRHDEIERLLADAEREGYSRGYADAIAAVTAAATAAANQGGQKPLAQVTPEPASASDSGAEAANGNGKTRGRPAKAIGLVRDAIYAAPGMKGVEIIKWLEEKKTPVLDRTVRSCLRRLNGKEVWQRKTRWYPKDKGKSGSLSGEAPGAALPH